MILQDSDAMKLKIYQQDVLKDLNDYLDKVDEHNNIGKAYSEFWSERGISLNDNEIGLKNYENTISGVPKVTVKVPTAGGKTFIACNALKTIFNHLGNDKIKAVVWFVPGDTILEQTAKNLKDANHPYRQTINSLFNGSVRVYEKKDLLFGNKFDPATVKEQLSIFVLSIQSFATSDKEGRLAYRENENLRSFALTYTTSSDKVENADETSLIQAIAHLNPAVIIDESHNFEADLRIEALSSINPSFILELTATPKSKSNIISFVDAMQLKKEHMVKLPVIVYNKATQADVIACAINLRANLEQKAIEQQNNGGKYIRPIVLFQAQPNTGEDSTTFEKIKEKLIDLGIPDEQIKIKTANKNELKGINLLDSTCEVRYIITVDALKEGWDCPFSYILASLANRTSKVEVEQILGRILRLPYTEESKSPYLNLSYVFTSSSDFQETLNGIISSLQKSGFSSKDYRSATSVETYGSQINEGVQNEQEDTLSFMCETSEENSDPVQEDEVANIDVEDIRDSIASASASSEIEDILEAAKNGCEDYNSQIEAADAAGANSSVDYMEGIKKYQVKHTFAQEINSIRIPLFSIKVKNASLFFSAEEQKPLTKEDLYEGFNLDLQDHNISFSFSSGSAMRIDLEERNKNEFVPRNFELKLSDMEKFAKLIEGMPKASKLNNVSRRIARELKGIDCISEPELVKYVKDCCNNLTEEQLTQITNNLFKTIDIFKSKISDLLLAYAKAKFKEYRDSGRIGIECHYEFPKFITTDQTSSSRGIAKSLYTEEDTMKDFEAEVISQVANLDNVEFWHRNQERGKGLFLNGFIYHYPDFIVKLKNGIIVLIETKGKQLANPDSKNKIELGAHWANMAGNKYRYFMVFEYKDEIENAISVQQLLDRLRNME